MKTNKIYQGNCLNVMKTWPDNVIDTIITDPPYGIRFMGKAWDGADIEKTMATKRRKTTKRAEGWAAHNGSAFAAGTYDQSVSANQAFQAWCTEWSVSALRIAKPGAMMLVCGGPRTFHRLTAGLEDGGWQIRDCMMWLYGSGFPKSHNLHGEFEGWGTALKPAWEPIIVAMKPLDGTFAQNAEKWGVAGVNVDGGRINGKPRNPGFVNPDSKMMLAKSSSNANLVGYESPSGRWPANLILDGDSGAMLGVASRFFYCAKASKSERGGDNVHPTVKPLKLMEYLCTLTKTPTGGVVLDPFAGSGTTLLAAKNTERPFIGIEMNPGYVAIAKARIAKESSQRELALS